MFAKEKPMSSVPVITIDGPSGAGKGTISYILSEKLGWHFLDSGVIYRCLAYKVYTNRVDLFDTAKITLLAEYMEPKFIHHKSDKFQVWLDNEDVTTLIRAENIGQIASKISNHCHVRQALLHCQRQFAQFPGLIADGRDMGTVVFPHAELKIFLEADPSERARRRYSQLKETNSDITLEQVTTALLERDKRDQERSIAPLVAANDAVTIDTTHISIAETVEEVLRLAHEKKLVVAQCV